MLHHPISVFGQLQDARKITPVEHCHRKRSVIGHWQSKEIITAITDTHTLKSVMVVRRTSTGLGKLL
jgi:hypothetical protein